LEFQETEEVFSIDDITVQTFDLPHPSGSLGYRFSANGSVLVVATDCELDQMAQNRDELAGDFAAPRIYDEKFLTSFRHADLLLIDCQYSDEEYLTKTDWGHNSIAAVVDLCCQVRPRMVALSHHDPMSNDETVTRFALQTSHRLRDRGVDDILVFGGRERLEVSVAPPKRSAKL
ncbi:MAG: MBL fold metallo-hydrolase, partial [Pirellulales bacterium]|nr:MBL fold metallo-hydrolase [Pirellulales bacterium]